ncbi:MAG: Era-like GTP-binding protein [Candidatus Aenigmatarchaeota archaeon]
MFGKIKKFFKGLFGSKDNVKLGIYGPTNVGKTSLANRISLDFTGEELGNVSEVPHETRTVEKKERVAMKSNSKELNMNLLDMPGISTKVDFKDFMDHGMEEEEAKDRAKEATKGIVEAIKWLDDVDACLVVFDSSENPYSQVNVTILGNLEAKDIPIILVANKIDLDDAEPEKIKDAFPQYKFIEVSAKEGDNLEDLYDKILNELG